MYRLNEVMRAKTRVPVDLLKIDGTQLQGYVFAGSQERVLDLMNSREPFLPIELSDGMARGFRSRYLSTIGSSTSRQPSAPGTLPGRRAHRSRSLKWLKRNTE